MGFLQTGYFLAIFAFFSNPPEDIAEERVDLIEINHFFDEDGKPKFDQVIFYRWSSARGRFDIVDYKQLRVKNQIPTRIDEGDGYVAIWIDKSDHNTIRRVHAKDLIETWTEHDPEMLERRYLPKDKRSRLPRMVDKRRRNMTR